MERHDPLSTSAPVEPTLAPVSARPKKSRKLSPLLREVAELKDETLAFLYAGPDQQPDDYQRSLERAGKIRDEFVQFCAANTYFSNWRQAWAAFMADQSIQNPPVPISEPPCATPVKTPALPRWKTRFFQAARI